jgi:hypothetical protein
LNYLRFKDFLVQLGLLTELSSMMAESKERGLLFDMWKILNGEQNDSVQTDDMRVLVQVILRVIDSKRVLNVAPKDPVETQSASQEMNETDKIGFRNNRDQYCIRHGEVQKLQSHFKIFYLNSLQF